MRRVVLALAVLPLALTACTDNNPQAQKPSGGATAAAGAGGGATTIRVSSSDTECSLSAKEMPSGNVVFDVTNNGSKITEFYLYKQDGKTIVGEVENIGPALSRELVLEVGPGKYVTACKPGMVNEGIRAPFTVTDSGADLAASGDDKQEIDKATTAYAAYVKEQTTGLLAKTKQFAQLYGAGKDDEARALYPVARAHWERIEPVAESFGDLDPKMDAREADVPAGETWTGWHVMEKDLWPPKAGYSKKTPEQRRAVAAQLVKDTEELAKRTATSTYTINQIANGSKSLLDEVATGKVTGEEEIWSHTDLYDFQANVDGARVAWQVVQPLLRKKDAALDAQLTLKFAALEDALDDFQAGEGYKPYTDLTKEDVRRLANAVNALSEPLSKVPAAVTL